MFAMDSCCVVQCAGRSKVSVLEARSKAEAFLDVGRNCRAPVPALHGDRILAPEPTGRERLASVDSLWLREDTAEICEEPQTLIAFDWDDVLFPTSYMRDEVGELLRGPPSQQCEKVAAQLSECDRLATELLRAAAEICDGRMAVVASDARWLDVSCSLFFPATSALILELGILIVAEDEQRESLATVAGVQSCVLSIGTGDNEKSSAKHCRTRLRPSASELATQLELLAAWLVPITKLSGPFSLDLA